MPPLLRALALTSLLTLLLAGCSDDSTPEGTDTHPPTTPPAETPAETTAVSHNAAQRVALTVLDISVQNREGRQVPAVTLSTPLALDRPFEQWLSIVTEGGDQPRGQWVADPRGRVLYFIGGQASKSYIVEVKSGLEAANGSVLGSDSADRVEIPEVQAALGFAGRGNLLAHRLRQGLPVMAVNVDQVDVDFYRVEPNQLVAFIARFGRSTQLDSWDARQLLPKVQLVASGRFDLALDPDTRTVRYLPLDGLEAVKASGVYLAVMRQAGGVDYRYPATWFAVTDLGAQVRLYAGALELQVNGLSDGKPRAEVSARLLGPEGGVLGEVKTDRHGRARFVSPTRTGAEVAADNPVPGAQRQADLAQARLLLLTQGEDTSLVKLTGPVLDLAEFPVQGRTRLPQELFIYSPRDLYRPGETLIFSALLRSAQGQAVPGIPLEARLMQPDGQVVSSQTLQPDALNYYEARLALPTDAATGEWRFRLQLPDGTGQEYPVKVETFLPERMALALTSEAYLEPNAALQIEVQGDYLYGAPAAGNRLQTQLLSRMEAHPFPTFADYWFGDPDDTTLQRREELQEIALDEQGRGAIDVDPFWQGLTAPLRLQASVSLLDSGGRPVTRHSRTVVLPAPQLPGIRPLFADAQVDYDSQAGFELILTDGEQRLAAEALEVSLVRERRDYHWSWSDEDGWQSHYSEHPYTVEQRTLSLAAGASQTVNFPVEWGYYRLEVRDPDSGLQSAYRFHAGWDPESQVMAGRPDRIGLALDKQAYVAGDKLRLQVRPPAAGKGVLLLESDRLLYRQEVEIPAEGKTFSLTLKPEWMRPDLYVSVLLLQPGDKAAKTLPKRMLGVAPVPLSALEQTLEVAFGELPASVRPEQTIEVPLRVAAAGGRALPERVQVTLAAVDVGVLSITGFATPDPLDWFFKPAAYGVQIRDNYGDLLEADPGEMARLRYGGDADLSRGGAQPPTEVQILSLFSGAVAVDAEGRARIPLQLPAFNGRIRLMAVAFSAAASGSAEQELQVVAPIVAELNRPRFLAPGDSGQLTLELHNRTQQAQTLTVALDAGAGLQLNGAGQHWDETLELAAGAKTTRRLQALASTLQGAVPLSLRIGGIDGEPDLQRHWSLGVRPAWPAQVLDWRQPLDAGADFSLDRSALQGLLPQTLNARLSLASRPPFNLASHFNALKAYPYGCAEQTTSGVFPQLYIDAATLAALQLEGDDPAVRREAVELAIRRLFGMQRSNGSFGLWSNESPEEPWLTVYITDFLLRAREAGYAVAQPALQQALEQIGRYLRNPRRIDGELQDERRSRFSVRAYAALVLARSRQAPLAELRNLADYHADDASPLAQVQLGLALQASGDAPRGERMLRQGLDALQQASFPRTDYGSRVRDRALALFWLLEASAAQERWMPLLDGLQQALAGREWLSTQERNALFLAGQALTRIPSAALQLQLSGAVELRVDGVARRDLRLAGEELLRGLQLHNSGEQTAWIALHLQGYSDQPPPAYSRGIRVERRFFDADGQPLALSQLQPGEAVLVELQVSSDESMHDALVVDLLPAGLELENQNLSTSLALGELQIDGESIAERMALNEIRHQEFRDDRYVAALALGWQHRARLYYLARAVTPGRYWLPPTYAESMYSPEIRHLGADAGVIEVRVPGAR